MCSRLQRHTITTPVAVVVEGNTVGHVSIEISRVFVVRNNTITCKVTDKWQSSRIPGKGLEVPMHAATGKPSQVENLVNRKANQKLPQ